MRTRSRRMLAAEQRGETLYEIMLSGCVGYDSSPTGRTVAMDGQKYEERIGNDGRLYRVRLDQETGEVECWREIRVDELPGGLEL